MDTDFDNIQKKINTFVTPSGMGRLPKKITKGFAGFTAEQFKNWTLYYSLVCLKDILPPSHYNCWKCFVKACHLLCTRSISSNHVTLGKNYLLQFLKLFVELYGPDKVTPNMHLHGHLTDCICDYGPVYSFWLFAFERMNGILGSYNTNSQHISAQLMKRFSDHFFFQPSSWPQQFSSEFASLITQSDIEYSAGSLAQSTIEDDLDAMPLLLPSITENAFNKDEILDLNEVLGANDDTVLALYQQSNAVQTVNGSKVIGSTSSKHHKSSVVIVTDSSNNTRLAEIKYFCKRKVEVCVRFFTVHECKVWFGKPVEVWSQCCEPGTWFLPVTAIKCRVVYADLNINFGRFIGNQDVRVAIPVDFVTEI